VVVVVERVARVTLLPALFKTVVVAAAVVAGMDLLPFH
jgi:hypothetical protein